MSDEPAAAPLQKVAVAGFCVLAIAAWLLLHLYRGIQHDAVLYTMQGLAHLRPDLYANDVFLKYGSQDRYTLFGSLYGALIGLLGIDHAAAVTTLLSQGLLFYCAWRLARLWMATDLALLAIALLAVLDLNYGSGGIFTAVEDFVTPRPLAEALVLAAIAAEVTGRRWIALASLLVACLMHPVMAMAGIAWFVATVLAAMRSRARVAAAALLLVALVLLLVVCAALQPPEAVVSDWFAMAVARAPYLVLRNWSPVDWAHLCPPCATLIVAAVTAQREPVRTVALTSIAVGVAGLLVSLAGADWLHIVLILQVQPWRWVWLGVVLAVILLPLVMHRLWHLGTQGRAALALLAALYAFQDEMYAPWLMILVPGACWLCLKGDTVPLSTRRLVLWGAAGLLLIALAWDVANRFVYARSPYILFHGMPRVTLLRQIIRDSVVPVLLLILFWWLAFHWHRRTAQAISLITGLLSLALILPIACERFSTLLFPTALYPSFEPWRSQIPEGAQVLWVGNPLEAWVLLERPSFYTEQQRTTTLFSHQAANVLRDRYFKLEAFLRSEGGSAVNTRVGDISGSELTLADVCAAPGIQFVATHHRFDARPIAILPAELPAPFGKLQLFACATGDPQG